MSTTPLVRPLRQILQGGLRPTAARSAQNAFARQTSQIRGNASIAPEQPPASAADTSRPAAALTKTPKPSKAAQDAEDGKISARMPRSLSSLYLQPLRRHAEYGVPSCDLQLRSYSLRNLEFFCDFALRAAYYMNLPAYGPVPLPRKIQRWTVPKSTFIFKKSQENFERVTVRRLIQIRDGHPETVQVWLAFLQKHQYYGVGMKANMWEFSNLDVGKTMNEAAKKVEGLLEEKWAHMGQWKSGPNDTVEKIEQFMASERAKANVGSTMR